MNALPHGVGEILLLLLAAFVVGVIVMWIAAVVTRHSDLRKFAELERNRRNKRMQAAMKRAQSRYINRKE